jgi:hypothetical protein
MGKSLLVNFYNKSGGGLGKLISVGRWHSITGNRKTTYCVMIGVY